jgi:class 3 adenylate cyclase
VDTVVAKAHYPALVSQPGESRTATFLMTDIAGSTRVWEEQRAAMVLALAAHDALLRSAVEEAGGTVFKTTGDGLLAAFERPGAAVRAALAGQRFLQDHAWPTGRWPRSAGSATRTGS